MSFVRLTGTAQHTNVDSGQDADTRDGGWLVARYGGRGKQTSGGGLHLCPSERRGPRFTGPWPNASGIVDCRLRNPSIELQAQRTSSTCTSLCTASEHNGILAKHSVPKVAVKDPRLECFGPDLIAPLLCQPLARARALALAASSSPRPSHVEAAQPVNNYPPARRRAVGQGQTTLLPGPSVLLD